MPRSPPHVPTSARAGGRLLRALNGDRATATGTGTSALSWRRRRRCARQRGADVGRGASDRCGARHHRRRTVKWTSIRLPLSEVSPNLMTSNSPYRSTPLTAYPSTVRWRAVLVAHSVVYPKTFRLGPSKTGSSGAPHERSTLADYPIVHSDGVTPDSPTNVIAGRHRGRGKLSSVRHSPRSRTRAAVRAPGFAAR